jgi:hypothetical protein
MARIAFNESIGTDRGEAIVGAMVAHLRQNSILLPSAAVLEKIALVARARARKQAYKVFGRRRHQFSKDRGKPGRDPPNDSFDQGRNGRTLGAYASASCLSPAKCAGQGAA